MITENSYFDGKVKSIGSELSGEKFTVGVMAPGEYSFGTSTVEVMEIIHGEAVVKLPGMEKKTYGKGEIFRVEKDVEFSLSVKSPASYLCLYK